MDLLELWASFYIAFFSLGSRLVVILSVLYQILLTLSLLGTG